MATGLATAQRNGTGATKARGGAKARPLAPGRDRTTADLAASMIDLFDGVMNDDVPLAKASALARIAGVQIRIVDSECRYGPQQHRRKAMPLASA